VDDLAFGVGEHGRRRELLEQVAVHRRRGVGRSRGRRGARGRAARRPRGARLQRPDRPADRIGAVDAHRLVDRREQARARVDRLGGAEEEVAAGQQREVEHLEHVLLRRPVEVDQQVAAAHQVQARERRVVQDVVLGEDQVVAQRLVTRKPPRSSGERVRRRVGGTSVTIAAG
jgi:hypothetical protein